MSLTLTSPNPKLGHLKKKEKLIKLQFTKETLIVSLPVASFLPILVKAEAEIQSFFLNLQALQPMSSWKGQLKALLGSARACRRQRKSRHTVSTKALSPKNH